ncbi:MAG: toxin TcdB middle/N-terminal domain-containing protein, partial [Roseimicrobium sp.]
MLSYHYISGGYEGLARSLELTYHENVYLSKLIAITQVAWDGAKGCAFPPVQLSYADVLDLKQARYESLHPMALPPMQAAFDQPRFSWTDLDAEGAPGVLFQAANGMWLYARNSGRGKLAAPQPVHGQAAQSSRGDNGRLLDLNGDGLLDWVQLQRPFAGRRERGEDYAWGDFVPFAHGPVLELADPEVRLFDLDGDGLPDLVRSELGSYLWQRSVGDEGFALPERLPWALDENKGPCLLFADRDAMVYLADLTGDGLTDFVRLSHAEVSFWPNLGHGNFGPRQRLTLRAEDGIDTGEPLAFDPSGNFEQRRIRLLDIDGTGSVDLAYIGTDGIFVWRNQSGNGFSRPVRVNFPPIADPDAVTVVDLLANGTSCLVYTPATPGFGTSAIYLHLVGGQQADPCESSDTVRHQKPHLLTRYTNHLGGEIRFHYTTSARFCVEDRDNGRPWFTKLAFPVQVIERVENRDLVTGKILINAYRYRHGYYDGKEREFRGFAFVEQMDSVHYDDFATAAQAVHQGQGGNADRAFHIPPVITRTWYHTGASRRAGTLAQRLRTEYFSGDSEAVVLPDTQLPDDLCGEESTEAVRALKGSLLRQEIYSGEDEAGCFGCDTAHVSGRPYSVSERSYSVRRVQGTGSNRFATFTVHPEQQIDFYYERQTDDPRVEHQFTLKVDSWGNVLQSAKVAYGRRQAGLSRAAKFLDKTELRVQSRCFVEFTQRTFSNAFGDVTLPLPLLANHLAPQIVTEKTWEWHQSRPALAKGWFAPDDFASPPPEVPYDTEPSAISRPCLRLIEHTEQSYWKADGSGALPLGNVDVPALPHRAWKLALTDAMVREIGVQANDLVPGYPLTSQMLTAGGYEKRGSHWWAKSPYQSYRTPFFLPSKSFDSFDHVSEQDYNRYHLFPDLIKDPHGDETRIDHDYRLLQPKRITDSNDSSTTLLFDTRGFVAVMALEGNGTNPTLDRISMASGDLTTAQIVAFAANPLAQTPGLLGSATTRFVYHLFAATPLDSPVWQPQSAFLQASPRVNAVWAATLARRFHISQEAAGHPKQVEIAFAYSDGFGEVAQTHQLTDPG